ncbi:MAG TPA: OsmC family protein [Nitrososphaerales archaeon]|nr:OsmC family protein [Nitrososphaerales archaeon]
MKLRADLSRVVIEDMKKREAENDIAYLHGAERVEVAHVEQLRFSARKREYEFIVDEPPERGGTGKGPNPLAYFIGGAAACLATQFLRVIVARSLKVDTFNLTAIGRFERKLGGGFSEIIYEVNLTGEEDQGTIVALSKRAQLQCYAHNTLSKAGVNLVTNVVWNGGRLGPGA